MVFSDASDYQWIVIGFAVFPEGIKGLQVVNDFVFFADFFDVFEKISVDPVIIGKITFG